MNVSQAFEDMRSADAGTRLRAARYLSSKIDIVDVEALRKFLLIEHVPWIRTALMRAIERSDISVVQANAQVETPADNELTERLINSIKAEAVEEVTGTILHEFSTVIGSMKMQALIEFPGFEESKTSLLLTRLGDLLKAIRTLRTASAPPTYTEFDLGDLVSEILSTDEGLTDVKIQLVGARPFITSADRNNMLLAIINGLRNAIEAVGEFTTKTPPEILINWGRAGEQDFLVIIDSGAGFPGNPSDALRIGVSGKEKHLGYGLATSLNAMRAMEGDLLVSNHLDGGARFELRWFKDNENSLG